MPRNGLFTFRVDEKEKQMLYDLSIALQRSRSDVLRILVSDAAKALAAGRSPVAPVVYEKKTTTSDNIL